MGLFDSILGRSQPPKPDLDQLFGLPSAAITLQVSLGAVPTGAGSVAFRAPEGKAFADVVADVKQLLTATSDPDLAAVLAHNRDEEKEHAAMTLEWLRRHDEVLDRHLRTYLFTDAPITEIEDEAEHGG